jgi:hypothetical protein
MAPETFTLYHHKFSICSIMVRYTIAIRGPPKDESSSILIEEQEHDIFHEEQLTEQFLCGINPKGQVTSHSQHHSNSSEHFRFLFYLSQARRLRIVWASLSTWPIPIPR